MGKYWQCIGFWKGCQPLRSPGFEFSRDESSSYVESKEKRDKIDNKLYIYIHATLLNVKIILQLGKCHGKEWARDLFIP